MTMYVQFLSSALAAQPPEEIPARELLGLVARRRLRLQACTGHNGVPSEQLLCREVAYDRALVALAWTHGISTDADRFDDREAERRRLEVALDDRGIDVRSAPNRPTGDAGLLLLLAGSL